MLASLISLCVLVCQDHRPSNRTEDTITNVLVESSFPVESGILGTE